MSMSDEKTFTRFERARIIGARALQLSRGAPPLFETTEKDSIRIAEVEFDNGAIPLDVKRKMPPRLD